MGNFGFEQRVGARNLQKLLMRQDVLRIRLWRLSLVTRHGGKLTHADPGLWETLTRTHVRLSRIWYTRQRIIQG